MKQGVPQKPEGYLTNHPSLAVWKFFQNKTELKTRLTILSSGPLTIFKVLQSSIQNNRCQGGAIEFWSNIGKKSERVQEFKGKYPHRDHFFKRCHETFVPGIRPNADNIGREFGYGFL
jgi:hypothetical protein